MTDRELYTLIVEDPDAVKALESDKIDLLYKLLHTKRQEINFSNLTRFLKDAGIDVHQSGTIQAGAYSDDKTLTSFDFRGVNTIDYQAFAESGIKSADLRSVKEIKEQAFYRSDITEVYLGDSIIHDMAFAGCKNLTEVYIPGNCKLSGRGIFMGCRSLEVAALDEGHNTLPSELFNNCRKLEVVYLPESFIIGGNVVIGTDIFAGCKSLRKVVLNVERMGDHETRYIRQALAVPQDVEIVYSK